MSELAFDHRMGWWLRCAARTTGKSPTGHIPVTPAERQACPEVARHCPDRVPLCLTAIPTRASGRTTRPAAARRYPTPRPCHTERTTPDTQRSRRWRAWEDPVDLPRRPWRAEKEIAEWKTVRKRTLTLDVKPATTTAWRCEAVMGNANAEHLTKTRFPAATA